MLERAGYAPICVYRDFTRVGRREDARRQAMGRWGVALGGDVIKQIHTQAW